MAWTEGKDVWRDLSSLSYMNKDTSNNTKYPELCRSRLPEKSKCSTMSTSVPFPCMGRGRAAISKAAKAEVDASYEYGREIYEHLRQTNPISYSNENIEERYGFKPQSPPVESQFEDAAPRNVLLTSLAKKREKELGIPTERKAVGKFTPKEQYVLESKQDSTERKAVAKFTPKEQYVLESKQDFPALK